MTGTKLYLEGGPTQTFCINAMGGHDGILFDALRTRREDEAGPDGAIEAAAGCVSLSPLGVGCGKTFHAAAAVSKVRAVAHPGFAPSRNV